MYNSIIDVFDVSGRQFLDEMIDNSGFPTKSIIDYMNNARNHRYYDFKERGSNHYRGMPLWDINGRTVYASARDIGNYVAGYYAGINGFSWDATRWAFDLYQSGGKERLSTTSAQYVGYEAANRPKPWIKDFSFFYSISQAPKDLSIFCLEMVIKAVISIFGK